MSRVVVLANGQQVLLDNLDVNFPPNLIDAFSRLRTSQPVTVLGINQSQITKGLFVTEGQVSGSGTSSTYSQAQAKTTLNVGTALGKRKLRTTNACIYQAGKSLLVFFTFNFKSFNNTVIKTVGLKDDNDGIYLECKDDLAWGIQSSVSGSIVKNRITQSNWNTNKFNTVNSGYNFDITKCHIGFIYFEWLGVGDVVTGFVYNQVPTIAHIFNHPNLKDAVYMRTANLFLTYEIEQTSAGGTASEMDAICATAISEGSVDQSGVNYLIKRDSDYTYTGINTVKPLILFRLNPNQLNARVLVTDFQVALTTNADAYVWLCRNPIFSTSPVNSWTSLNNKSIQYDNAPNTASTITNILDCVVSGYILSTKSSSENTGGSNVTPINFLGSDFNNTSEIWCVALECTTTPETITRVLVQFLEQI